ncbi:MAG: endonuclease/exonuclease/phosphatase family protein [Bacteroidota bacterium]
MQKKKILKMILALLSPFILFGIYVVGVLIYGTFNDWKPEEKISISIDNPHQIENKIQEEDSTFSLISWNVGYGGLGANADFFYDGGKMVRSSKVDVTNYIKGIQDFLSSHKETDFVLLQEVDLHSKRSYYTNEYEKYSTSLQKHTSSIALNFKVPFVPIKYFEPIGHVESGVATYSKFNPINATRYQFPGEFGWPTRLFNLDRCFLVNRFQLPKGKELLVINTHNSAYDKGDMKKAEMEYLYKFLLEEYAKGNYIIVGGDWNQCPPGFQWDKFAKTPETDYSQISIKEDFMPGGWTWAYDDKVATNRKLTEKFDASKTFTTVIDFYLLSPNLQVEEVSGVHLDFKYSDHQPVKLKCKMK